MRPPIPGLLTFVLLLALAACTRSAPIDTNYTPPAPLPNSAQGGVEGFSLPTGAPPALLTYLPPTRMPGVLAATPTPNVPQILPTFTPVTEPLAPVETPTPGPLSHTVEPGGDRGSSAAP